MKLRMFAIAAWIGMSVFFGGSSQAAFEVSVTVDDLPMHGGDVPGTDRPTIAANVIRALKRNGVGEAYGFLNYGGGGSTEAGKAVLGSWIDAGYALANHTFSHRDLTLSDVPSYIADIEANEPGLAELSRGQPWSTFFFRYPNLHEGETLEKRNAIRNYLRQRGYQIAQVTIDSGDWEYTAPYERCMKKGDQKALQWMKKKFLKDARGRIQKARAMAEQLTGRSIRHILIVHMSAFEAEMLAPLLEIYVKEGARFIGLPQALEDPVYSINPNRPSATGRTFLDQFFRASASAPRSELESLCR